MHVKSRFPLVTLGITSAFVIALLASVPPGAYGQELPLQLTWVDREGKAIESVGPPGSYRGPDVASDGRVAVHQHDRLGGDIYLIDTKGQMTRLTTDATGTQENSSPIFSADGTRIVFASLRNGKWGLYLKGVSGGREELLYESGSRKMPMAWSPDGQYIIYWVASGAGQWVMPVKNPSAARPLHDRQNTHAQISPDGKWVAFNSQNQIFIKPFPTGEGLWKVSIDNGGAFVRWRGDSKELYYLSRVSFGQMMAVEINANGSTLQPGKPRALFDSRYVNLNHPSNYHTYSVAADGKRFLVPRVAAYNLTVFDRGGKVVKTLDHGVYTSPAWSPDGTRVGLVRDTRYISVIDATTGKSTALASNQPEDVVTGLVWSPDGRQVAFHVRKIDQELIYRVSADGTGTPELVSKLPGFGLALNDWSPDGKYLIYYSQQLAGNRLFALPLTPEPKPIEIMRSDNTPINNARISPDGRLIAYQSTETPESPKQVIYVRTLDLAAGKTGETAQQVKGDPSFGMGLGISWRQDGRELYYLAPKHAVMAVEVTAAPALQLGTPRMLFTVPDATNDAQNLGLNWGNVARDGQRVVYSVAPKGASAPTDPTFQLALLDRQGKVLRRVGPVGRYGQTALSPDGARIATRWFDTFQPGGRSDIWVVDIASGKTTPITNDAPPDFAPMWSPDGKQIYYVSARSGGYQGIYRKSSDGTGDAELIYRYDPGAPVNLRDISADGKYLLFNSGGVILVVPMSGDAKTRKAIELSREEFVVNGGVFSPDGKFIAFTSNETEAFELYVRPFDAATGAAVGDTKYRVSKEGAGGLMVWRNDGRELYFMDAEPDLKVMAVDISTSPNVQTGAPKVLFEVPGDAQGDLGTTRYISRDGQRFVFVLPAEGTNR
jgi:Tol biopolymer transport system component